LVRGVCILFRAEQQRYPLTNQSFTLLSNKHIFKTNEKQIENKTNLVLLHDTGNRWTKNSGNTYLRKVRYIAVFPVINRNLNTNIKLPVMFISYLVRDWRIVGASCPPFFRTFLHKIASINKNFINAAIAPVLDCLEKECKN
jgi:hypothetical protein